MQRVRRSGRPFFRSRGRGFLARSGETGALRVERRFTPGGFNKCPRIERPYLGGPKARPQPRTRLRGRGGDKRGQELPRLAGRPPKSKWPRDFCAAKRLGASCGRPGSAFGGWFWAKRKGAWASRSPKRTILGQNRPFKARFKRRAQPEARIGGGVGLAAICRVPHSRAPRPEARRRRAQERGRVPRRTPPTFAERVPATKCAGKRVHPQPSRGSRPRSVSG